VVRRVQTWEASRSAAHGVATPALLLGDFLGAELNEMTQDVGTSLSRVQRSGGVDGVGELIGLGEQVARTNGRHRPKCVTDSYGATPGLVGGVRLVS
jgi:hypothetical protein